MRRYDDNIKMVIEVIDIKIRTGVIWLAAIDLDFHKMLGISWLHKANVRL